MQDFETTKLTQLEITLIEFKLGDSEHSASSCILIDAFEGRFAGVFWEV